MDPSPIASADIARCEARGVRTGRRNGPVRSRAPASPANGPARRSGSCPTSAPRAVAARGTCGSQGRSGNPAETESLEATPARMSKVGPTNTTRCARFGTRSKRGSVLQSMPPTLRAAKDPGSMQQARREPRSTRAALGRTAPAPLGTVRPAGTRPDDRSGPPSKRAAPGRAFRVPSRGTRGPDPAPRARPGSMSNPPPHPPSRAEAAIFGPHGGTGPRTCSASPPRGTTSRPNVKADAPAAPVEARTALATPGSRPGRGAITFGEHRAGRTGLSSRAAHGPRAATGRDRARGGATARGRAVRGRFPRRRCAPARLGRCGARRSGRNGRGAS